VVAEGVVVTAAHVVAGVNNPRVLDASGNYPATPIWFDPDKDVAVLRVDDLRGPPLSLTTSTLSDRDAAAVLGFPGGGPLVVTPAVIIDHVTATGRDVYNRGLIFRNIYEVQAVVEPGNSGGPLVGPDGAVAGIVFSTSLSQDNIAYALMIDEVKPLIQQALQNSLPVSTGGCDYD
jgi:S1-C subfamily serine protease